MEKLSLDTTTTRYLLTKPGQDPCPRPAPNVGQEASHSQVASVSGSTSMGRPNSGIVYC